MLEANFHTRAFAVLMSGSPKSIVGAREDFLAVPGARLYVRQVGAGPPLVILHGGPDFNHHYLLPEMDDLAPRFSLVYYDQRGRGKSSDGVAPEDVTIASEVDDLDRLRAHLGVDAMAILGHSWGCVLAMEYTARHPASVSHLILLNTAPSSHADLLRTREHRQSHHSEYLARMSEIAKTSAYAEGDVAVEAELYRAHFGPTFRRPETLEMVVGRLRTHFTPADILKARAIEDRLYEQTWLQPDYDAREGLARASKPVLVIHGENDLIPVICAKSIVDAVPGARYLLLPECGHFAYLERPAETFDAIETFYAKTT